jgi:hypothetical protein
MPNDSGLHTFTCTPSSLLASYPCLDCISEKDMLAVLVGIFAISEGHTIADVMKDSACFNCMSKKQMLQGLTTLLGSEILGERTSMATVIDTIKCLQCASKQQLLAAILYLLCHSLENSFTYNPQT